VAAAVILNYENPILGLNDSKKLSASKREKIIIDIKKTALAIGIGIVDHITIDEINILNATKKAMTIAFNNLKIPVTAVLIDAVLLKDLSIDVYPIIKGDTLSASIAAASIVAKVTRDHIMEDYHKQFPQYGFNKHKGYPTKQHLNILKEIGPTPIHRKSFSPVRNIISQI